MMILVWALIIIIISVTTRWVTRILIQKESVYITRLVASVSCAIQFVFVYLLMKAIVYYLAQALDVFYR